MVSWRSNIKVKAKVKTRYKMPIFCPSSANKVKVYHFSVGYLDILGIFSPKRRSIPINFIFGCNRTDNEANFEIPIFPKFYVLGVVGTQNGPPEPEKS